MIGNINSFETMGLVDGPGIRFVLFMQGCPLRCIYCHNPETWSETSNLKMNVNEVLEMVLKYKPYFKEDGGITVSGGEPLLQSEFVTELFKECKKNNINTCLDTSGYGDFNDELLEYTDIVLLDIKGITEKDEIYITGKSIPKTFINKCQNKNIRIWLRHVIIPNINDTKEYILSLKEYIKDIKYEKIELLPYHSLAENKYDKLNLIYRLKGYKDITSEKIIELSKLLLD